MTKKIGILLIATGKYISFVDQFITSANEYFMKGTENEVYYFVFTDSKIIPEGAIRIFQKHKKFPYPTLMRYHIFLESKKLLSKMDYLFYCDVDTRFVSKVGEEVLGNLVATKHGLFYNVDRRDFTYENQKESTAYIRPKEGKYYFCGGFNGGKTRRFLKMAKTIARNIDKDEERNIVAVWHDESHLNRYLINYPPDKILDPGYCYPEGGTLPFTPRLLALNKDHAGMRYSGLEKYSKMAWYKFLETIGPTYRSVKKFWISFT